MATVLLSGKLVDSIIWNIQRPLDEKAAQIERDAHKIVDEIAFEIWDTATKDKQTALYAADRDFVRHSNNLWIVAKMPWDENFCGQHTLLYAVPVTPAMTTSPGLLIPKTHPRYAEIVDLLSERTKLRAESREVEPKFKELCSKCGSLADVVKIFPTVMNYLDDETKARLARKVKRRKNKPTELPEDLASSLVKSRIFQSTSG